MAELTGSDGSAPAERLAEIPHELALSIGLSLVPPAVEQPWVFEAKVLGGTVVFLGIGLALSRRGTAKIP